MMNLRGARAWLAPATAFALASATADAWLSTGPLPQAWRNWHYSRAIKTDSATEAQLVSIVVPPEVHIQAQSRLEDLRVINDAGTEGPYILYAPTEFASTRVARPE